MSKAIERRDKLVAEHKELISRPNAIDTTWDNGIYDRYVNPVITPAHIPLSWRYDLDPNTNPNMMERLGINATLNPGAIKWNDKFVVCVRIEGYDRKSFFGLAESDNGIDNFKFIGKPIQLAQVDRDDTNVYDMRLVKHEDGYVYGLFCSERKDLSVPASDTSTAEAQCGLVRTKDLVNWERLPDLKSPSAQQRNVVLHPEFIDGKYALYTRPQDGFIETGKGGGIGWGLCSDMTNPVIEEETVIQGRAYHTVYEVKNGMGPAPIKTDKGWLQLAHGVRNTAARLRYVLYMFLSDLEDPTKVIAHPGGHFMAPQKSERVGDVSNVLFSNGWIKNDDGSVNIYYASSDTLCHVATTTVDKLLDYVINTPADPLASHLCVDQRCELIDKNDAIAKELGV